MNEAEVVVATVGSDVESALEQNVVSLQEKAADFVVTSDEEYSQAAEFGKIIKKKASEVKEFFKPLKEQAHKAHKAICDRESEMLKPLENAESIIKSAMSRFVADQKRKKEEQERAMRIAAERERERLLIEAEEREKNGDIEGANDIFTEAVIMDEATTFSVSAPEVPKVSGVSTSKDWEIESIDDSKVPVALNGVTIRPVDKSAVMRIIRASKGSVVIPGITYKEVAKMTFRR